MLPPGMFDNQVVLVTGGGTGLGKAIGVEFARLGATVAIVSRQPEHLHAGTQAIGAVGGKGVSARCDVRNPESVAAAFDSVAAAAGPVAVLINNAAGNFTSLA